MKIKTNRRLQEELAAKLNKVKWHGGYYTACCPFHHNVNTPAMFVYGDFFVCMSCGEQGPLSKLEKKLSGGKVAWVSDEEVSNLVVPEWNKYRDEFGSYEKAAIHAYKTAKKHPVLVKYLSDRKLPQIVSDGHVGYLYGWLSFPVFDPQGNMVDWVLRKTPNLETDVKYATRPRKRKGEGFHLYCPDWDRVFNSSEIYIPFGILDCWTLHYAGFPSATGLTGLKYQVNWFNDLRMKIHLIPDFGEEEAAYKFAKEIGWRADVICLPYKDNQKDSNDILRDSSFDHVRMVVEGAK